MGNRKKIGIIYEYNENWIGGTYYIQNLISALKSLSKAKIPRLYIYTEKDEHYEQLKVVTQYPFLERGTFFIRRNRFHRAVNKVWRRLKNKEYYSPFSKEVQLVFPAGHESNFHPEQKFIYWIPDFQEHYLPEFFDKTEVAARKAYQQSILCRAKNIIFSSVAVQEDFNFIYPDTTLKQFVLPFAVTHPKIEKQQSCLAKYNITTPYFICCNQFWKHKNHMRVLEAIHILKKKGEEIHVVFTGKEHDYRNPDFFEQLKIVVKSFSIEENTSFLGFIQREDQLSLINSSIAVIQPSLFEGWSTTIEDAKSLQVNIIASDIKVHREQLQAYQAASFFNPDKAAELADKLESGRKEEIKKPYDYSTAIKEFGNNFMRIVNSV